MLDYRKMMLLYEKGSTKNNLAEIFSCKWETVDRAITRIRDKWGDAASIPSDLSNEAIRAEIFKPTREADGNFLQPDFSEFSREDLKRKMNSELWVSYCDKAREQGKQAYQPTKFNELLAAYKRSKDISYPQTHEPGLACQVDWTGDYGHFMDEDTGEWIDVHVLVISLPYSGYFYAEGFLDEKMDSFLKGHEHAFQFFGGVTPLTISDNCATAVDRKTGILNTQYTEFLDYYGTLPKPTRVKAPKDKGSVEAHVKVVEKGILPVLDRLPILSLAEYNRFLIDKVVEKNANDWSKKEGSRLSLFLADEKPRLQPLPDSPFHRIIEKPAVVSRDFHLQYSNAFYSVPVDYVGKTVIVRDDGTTIRIYSDKDKLIAEHRKAVKKWQRCTNEKHIPKGHDHDNKAYSLEYFLSWAEKYGPNTVKLCQAIVSDFRFPVQAFRTLRTILSKAHRCNNTSVVEEAAEKCYLSAIHTSKGFTTTLSAVSAEQKREAQSDLDLNSLYCTRYNKEDNRDEN